MTAMAEQSMLLRMAADVLDDLEKTRIANENRMRSLAQDGFGERPEAASLAGIVDGIAKLEHEAQLALQRTLRKHPLGPWVKATVGLGEKQAGRLLAAVGDPYWNSLHDRPRTVSELWAFCGYHVIKLPVGHALTATHRRGADGTQSGGNADHVTADAQRGSVGVAPSRRRGQRANWSGEAKMRAFLCAESCVKQRHSPYRKVYDDAREHYAEAIHETACVRCGPSGKPAEVGSALSDGHKHARAMRKVAKEILKDAWRESKKWHEPQPETTGD